MLSLSRPAVGTVPVVVEQDNLKLLFNMLGASNVVQVRWSSCAYER